MFKQQRVEYVSRVVYKSAACTKWESNIEVDIISFCLPLNISWRVLGVRFVWQMTLTTWWQQRQGSFLTYIKTKNVYITEYYSRREAKTNRKRLCRTIPMDAKGFLGPNPVIVVMSRSHDSHGTNLPSQYTQHMKRNNRIWPTMEYKHID